MRIGLIVPVISLIAALAPPAAAQERPFLLSIATTRDTRPAVRVDYDAGIGERAFQSDVATRPEQRVGVQASRGRFMFVARVGVAEIGSSYESSQSGEALYSFKAPARGLALAAGGGVLHEAGGVNVLLARVVAGHGAERWNLDGNLLFQEPMSSERDAVDVITSVGWSWKLTRSVSLGLEAIGEDLEGFWEQEEAEGGARLLAGPSVRVAPDGRRWQLIATGGPMFHPADNGRASGALRDLPPDRARTGYAFKVSLSVDLLSPTRKP